MPKVKSYQHEGIPFRWIFICPGCEHRHYVPTQDAHVADDKLIWTFNGDIERPTFSPSLMLKTGKYVVPDFEDDFPGQNSICHSIVTDGMIHFCGDSTHHLSGQTLPLPEIE
jgi:hypothetical protein